MPQARYRAPSNSQPRLSPHHPLNRQAYMCRKLQHLHNPGLHRIYYGLVKKDDQQQIIPADLQRGPSLALLFPPQHCPWQPWGQGAMQRPLLPEECPQAFLLPGLPPSPGCLQTNILFNPHRTGHQSYCACMQVFLWHRRQPQHQRIAACRGGYAAAPSMLVVA